jgi:hypothetical protein
MTYKFVKKDNLEDYFGNTGAQRTPGTTKFTKDLFDI